MNTSLSSNRPEDCSKEEFEKIWNSSGYSLSALYKTIHNYIGTLDNVKATDFDCPNHYAKLAFQAGKKAAYEDVLALLPDSAK